LSGKCSNVKPLIAVMYKRTTHILLSNIPLLI